VIADLLLAVELAVWQDVAHAARAGAPGSHDQRMKQLHEAITAR
jgi:hypothetical protein